jgi:hypothetical protein
MQSGALFLPLTSKDTKKSIFTFMASHPACGGLNASAELACMRKLPISKIEKFLASTRTTTLSFILHSHLSRSHLSQMFAKIPAIVSNTANEEVALISYPKDPTNGPNQTLANEETLSAFICPSANTSTYRTDTNSQAISATFIPRPWMGPYHASDLLMMFALVKATEIRGRNSNLGSAR